MCSERKLRKSGFPDFPLHRRRNHKRTDADTEFGQFHRRAHSRQNIIAGSGQAYPTANGFPLHTPDRDFPASPQSVEQMGKTGEKLLALFEVVNRQQLIEGSTGTECFFAFTF